MALKHIGRVKRNKRKIVVAYRTLPGDPYSCVVVTTENLMGDEHDTLMKLVESNTGQTADELADAMARTSLPDGRIMLAAFHATGKMVKLATNEVEMTPDTRTIISLDELNKIIAEQKGVSLEELAVKEPTSTTKRETTKVEEPVVEETTTFQAAEDTVLSDEQIAAQYRSQADTMFKEAKRLREEAEKLVPTKKKTKSD
jgi:hypothetical protein